MNWYAAKSSPEGRATVVARLEEYEAKTAPLRPFYEKSGRLARIDGLGDIDAIFARINKAVG